MQKTAIMMDLSKCGGVCRGDCLHYAIGKACPSDATYSTSYRQIADPQTWGDLKKVIADFPDKAPIGWINQPRQSIFSREVGNTAIIGFQ